MKAKLVYSVLLVCAVGLLFLMVQRWMIHVIASQDLNVKPFTSTVTHYTVSSDRKPVTTAIETVARTRSGALVHVSTAYGPKGEVYSGMRRIDFPDGAMAMIADEGGAKATGHRPDTSLAQTKQALANQPLNCLEARGLEKLDGQDNLFGQVADRISVDEGNRRAVVWKLPAFNCQIVQSAFQIKTTIGYETYAGSVLTSFQERDPDSKLFDGFASFKEMPPSQLIRTYFAAHGLGAISHSKGDDAMDKNYNANK